MRLGKTLTLGLAGLLALGALAACGSSDKPAARDDTAATGGGTPLPAAQLALVAYSTPQEAYEKIIAAFQKTTEGKNITFTQSYGASGDQSRAVENGLPADVVAFSLEPDMTRLVKGSLVAADWNSDAHKGMITDSVVVLGVRTGNPKKVKGWGDLTKSGIEIITPNPFTSGGARWNVMAAYGAAGKVGQDDAAGVAYLNSLFKNVPVQDDSARKSLQTFVGGKGDVILAYENEAIFAKQKGQALEYVLPEASILIENPAAVTAKTKYPEQAKAFLAFLHSKTAQRIFADNGYRPVIDGVAKTGEFKDPATLFTIAELGGWADVTKKFFDPQAGVMAAVERSIGVSTEKK
jgi:sulfate transport system substrate-binding protein